MSIGLTTPVSSRQIRGDIITSSQSTCGTRRSWRPRGERRQDVTGLVCLENLESKSDSDVVDGVSSYIGGSTLSRA